jgi:hypothetical protein
MPITIVKIIRDKDGGMAEMVEQEVPFDTIEAYERAEFLKAFHVGDQEWFDEVLKSRIQQAVLGAGAHWRVALETEAPRINAWLREDWQKRTRAHRAGDAGAKTPTSAG